MERTQAVAHGRVRLAVREWPGGDPPILLLNGLASSSHIWDLVVPQLARAGHGVVAHDQRGHGWSSKPTSGYGFDQIVEDGLAVISSTGLDRPVVVGHSWGANVTLELGIRKPTSVRSLVLVDGGFLNLRDRMDWPTMRAPPDLRATPVHEFLEMLRFMLHGQVEITPRWRGLPVADAGRCTRQDPPPPVEGEPPADPPRLLATGRPGAAPRGDGPHPDPRGAVGAPDAGLHGVPRGEGARVDDRT